jgi:hypothetical protein
MNSKLREMRERAKIGALSNHEIEWVASELSNGSSSIDKYELMLIISSGKYKQYKYLIDNILRGNNLWLSKLALEILCIDWSLEREYRADILRFMEFTGDDDAELLRDSALIIAGRYLRSYLDDVILSKLLSIVDDTKESAGTRHAAYIGLMNAMRWEMQPSMLDPRKFDPSRDIDQQVLRLAKLRLKDR